MSAAWVPAGPVRVNPLRMPEGLAALDTLVASGQSGYVCFCEANLLAHCMRDAHLVEVLDKGALVFPDGTATALLARISERRLVNRIRGPEFLLEACGHGLERGWRHYFLGGAENNTRFLVERLERRFPGLQVAGWQAPPFRPWTEDEQRSIASDIESSGADLVWVALGSPRQEFWIAELASELDSQILLGVGAAFDFHTGVQRWAPVWIRKLGLEWLYRMVTGGSRVFRRNLRCVPGVGLLVVKEWIRVRLLGAEPRGQQAPERASEPAYEVERASEPQPQAAPARAAGAVNHVDLGVGLDHQAVQASQELAVSGPVAQAGPHEP